MCRIGTMRETAPPHYPLLLEQCLCYGPLGASLPSSLPARCGNGRLLTTASKNSDRHVARATDAIPGAMNSSHATSVRGSYHWLSPDDCHPIDGFYLPHRWPECPTAWLQGLGHTVSMDVDQKAGGQCSLTRTILAR